RSTHRQMENRTTKRWSLWIAAAIGGGCSILGALPSLTNPESYFRWTLKYGNPAEATGMIVGAIFAFPLIAIIVAFIRNCWRDLRNAGYRWWHIVLRLALFFVLWAALCFGLTFVVAVYFVHQYILLGIAQVLGLYGGAWVSAWLTGLLKARSLPPRVEL